MDTLLVPARCVLPVFKSISFEWIQRICHASVIHRIHLARLNCLVFKIIICRIGSRLTISVMLLRFQAELVLRWNERPQLRHVHLLPPLRHVQGWLTTHDQRGRWKRISTDSAGREHTRIIGSNNEEPSATT